MRKTGFQAVFGLYDTTAGDDDTFTLIDTSHGSSTGSDRVFSWPKRMYFPLPESETMSNPNLQQNKYW